MVFNIKISTKLVDRQIPKANAKPKSSRQILYKFAIQR